MTVRYRGRHVFDTIEANQFVGFPAEYKGNVYYVDGTNGSNNNSGKSWSAAFATIAKALTIADDWDAVILLPGDFEEDGLEITQRGLKLIGLANTGMTRAAPLLIGDSQAILKVAAHDVSIQNLGFVQTHASPAVYVGESAAIWRFQIAECYFDGYGTCTYGLQLGAPSGLGEAVAAHVRRCKFISIATACLYNNSENTLVEENIFRVYTASIGILDVPDGSNRPDRYYLNNWFATADNVNATGISFSGTPTGQVLYDGNKFVNFADKTKCATIRAGLMGENYDDNAILAA